MGKHRQSGDLIGDRYRVCETLGEGTSGVTYAAEEVPGGRPVAIKQLRIARLGEWKRLELLEREARTLAHLRHPRVPAFVEFLRRTEEDEPACYLVRSLVPGRSLAQVVEAGWRATEAEVRGIADQLLEILVYLQSLAPPVIHRDIKPQNLIKDREGAIHLVDFGAVQSTTRDPGAGGTTVVGTFGYMAPEQFQGRASRATDLYGLATTLLFLLTHRSPADLPQRKLKIDFRQCVRLAPPLMSWLDRMLEPAPEDRYATAAEALSALRAGWAPARRAARWPVLLRWGAGAGAALGLAGYAASRLMTRPPPVVPVAAVRIIPTTPPAPPPLPQTAPAPPGDTPRFAITPDVTIAVAKGYVSAIAFSPDGRTLATGGRDGNVKLWNARNGALVRELRGHTDRISAVVFTPDGKILISGGDTTVWLWDASTGDPLRTLPDHSDQIVNVALDRSGAYAAAGSIDGGVKLWSLARAAIVTTVRAGDGLQAVALAPDARVLATGSDGGEIRVWDLGAGTITRKLSHDGGVTKLAFGRDGASLFSTSSDRTVRVWEVATGHARHTLSGHTKDVWALAVAPDGNTVFSADRDGYLRIWNLARDKSHGELLAHVNGTFGIALDPGRSRMATSSGDGSVRVWTLGSLPLGPWTAP